MSIALSLGERMQDEAEEEEEDMKEAGVPEGVGVRGAKKASVPPKRGVWGGTGGGAWITRGW